MSLNEHNHAISLVRANLVSLVLLPLLTALCLVPYVALWGWDKLITDFALIFNKPILFLVLLVAGILAHEMLHGLTWKLAGGKSWSAIKFGVNWKALAPYAHCREPLEVNAYRWGAAMPGLLLGIIPFSVGLITGGGWYVVFGYIFTITAAGDMLILWLIRRVDAGTLVQDHPTLAGCEIVQPADRPEHRKGNQTDNSL